MATESIEIDYSKYDLLSVREAALREGVTEKTIYNRLNRGYYKTQQDGEKTLVWVRKLTESNRVELGNASVVEPEFTHAAPMYGSHPSVVGSEGSAPTSLHALERLTDKVLDQADEISKLSENIISLSKTVSERDTTIQTLNHQLSATQNRLIHIREQENDKSARAEDKALIESLTQQLQLLQAQMQAQPSKAWWQFWR